MRKKFDKDVLQKLVEEALPGESKIQPVEAGVVTNVYRVLNKGKTHYLRITYQENISYQPEVIAHQKMLSVGAKVPRIIYHRNYSPEIDNHSFMIIEEIPGKPLSEYNDWQEMDQIFIEAGKDLAKIHSIPVDGFGWIERESKENKEFKKLKGPFKNYSDYYFHWLDRDLKRLVDKDILTIKEADQVKKLKTKFEKYLDYDQAVLTQGDSTICHIYCDQGKYTGMIDFGGMRGASPYFDLGHFLYFSGQTDKVFPKLIEGYQTVNPLPKDYQLRVDIEGVLISIFKLSWIIVHLPENLPDHGAIPKLKKSISVLNSKF